LRLPEPLPTDYASFYKGYVDKVGEKNPIELLISSRAALMRSLELLSDTELSNRYAPDKWSVKELLVHLSDSETIFACRLLHILRNDTNVLPGFDENLFVEKSFADQMNFSFIKSGLESSGHQFLHFAMQVNNENAHSSISANGKRVSAAALVYINAGHFVHHCEIIIDRYGIPVAL